MYSSSFTCVGVKTCVGGGLEISDCARGSLTDEEEECLLIRFSSLACKQSTGAEQRNNIKPAQLMNNFIQKRRIPISLRKTKLFKSMGSQLASHKLFKSMGSQLASEKPNYTKAQDPSKSQNM